MHASVYCSPNSPEVNEDQYKEFQVLSFKKDTLQLESITYEITQDKGEKLDDLLWKTKIKTEVNTYYG